MSVKTKQIIIGSIIITVIAVVVVVAVLIQKYTPNKEMMELSEHFGVEQDEVAIILQDTLYSKDGILIDGEVYIDYDTVKEYFNHRFYWDNNENLLIYTTPSEIIKASVSSKDYFVNKSKSSLSHNIVKVEGNTTYIAISYVKLFSDIAYTVYDNPKRIVIKYQWDEIMYADIKKLNRMRTESNIKSKGLIDLNKDDSVKVLEFGDKWSKVQTEDGITGYIMNKFIKDTKAVQDVNHYIAPIYSSIQKDYIINMVWHQVTNQTANEGLSNLILNTKGVNTVSPTWFSVIDNSGNISSLASETYVSNAHQLGVEVWALIDDFNKEININTILSYTSKREKIANELIATAIKYNIDGINIDFENISSSGGEDFIQFIRELSVKCRNNGIILSIDNYVPRAHTAHYNRKEQGIVADYVIIMGYDEYYAGSEVSGSVASIGFVEEGIVSTLKEVQSKKVINGIPFYTRLWVEENGVKVSSEAYGMTGAENNLKDNQATIVWNEEAGQNYAEYEKDDKTYKMWIEDERSIELKMELMKTYDLAGVSAWKLGLEKKAIWDTIIKYTN